ncbi:MAG: hypothetical protein ACKOPI_06555 [bacterium]
MIDLLLGLLLAGLVVGLVTVPFRREGTIGGEDPEIAELEAARDSKFREIRDCEDDFRTGKLEQSDFERLEASLRSEAVEILERLDAARGSSAGSKPDSG